MTFSQFCLNNVVTCKPRKEHVVYTMADIGATDHNSLRNKELNRIRLLVDEFEIRVDTFFVKLEVPDLKIIRYCPDDESWLLGRSRRGVWVAVDDNVVYVIAKEPKFEMNARKVAADISRSMRDIFDIYSVTGCWAM